MNQETKVGLFLIAAIGVILMGILFLGNIRIFHHAQRFYVEFENVEALPSKAAVKVAGVEIGKVIRVLLVKGRAQVTIDVQPDIAVYSDAVARIGSTGIIGTKFVELLPGTPEHDRLPDGATIQGVESASLDQMVAKISKLFEDDDKYGNTVTNLKETVANIRNVSRALNVAMGDHARDMEEIVLNVRDLTESIKVFAGHLEEITTEHKEDIKVAIEKFRGVGEKLDALLGRINEGKGVIGAMVSDDKAGEDAKEAVASIKDTANQAKKFFGKLSSINVYWDYRYRYDFTNSQGKTDLGLKIVPRPGKFYFIGGTNLGERPDRENETQFEKKNRFDGLMGQDYGPFTGWAGVIRSRGGVGLAFRPFFFNPVWNRRVELTGEVTDFNRDRTVNGKHLTSPYAMVGAHMALNKWLWVGARVEDLLEESAFMMYTNITFRDEDIASFFGLAAVSPH